MKKGLLFVILLLLFNNAFSQEEGIDFLPVGLNFLPLKGNMYEPRLGVVYFPDDRSLKVDIGNSIDIILLNDLIKDCKVSVGIDFMAYGLASSYQGKRLQIDALDGFFGGNATFAFKLNNYEDFKIRFRIIHNSAHLVDGSYNLSDNSWKNDYLPVPYARDFIEPTFAYEKKFSSNAYRVYLSPSYSLLIRPEELKRWSFNTGGELYFGDLTGKVFGKQTNLFFAYHFSLIGSPVYSGNNHILAGLKMGDYFGKGVNFFLSYYTGTHYFSEYYVKKNY